MNRNKGHRGEGWGDEMEVGRDETEEVQMEGEEQQRSFCWRTEIRIILCVKFTMINRYVCREQEQRNVVSIQIHPLFADITQSDCVLLMPKIKG